MTSMAWINSTQDSLLLTGADDGIVRVWDGLLQAGTGGPGGMPPPRLVTALDAAPGMRMGQSSGLVADWQQETGLLFTGGAGVHLKAWDLGREQYWANWEVPEDTAVTGGRGTGGYGGNGSSALSSNVGSVMAGFVDGSVRLYDARERRAVQNFLEHDSWIVNLHLTKEYEMRSACLSGTVRVWDIRKESKPIKSIVVQRSSMTALTVHNRVPIMASGSHNQFIKVRGTPQLLINTLINYMFVLSLTNVLKEFRARRMLESCLCGSFSHSNRRVFMEILLREVSLERGGLRKCCTTVCSIAAGRMPLIVILLGVSASRSMEGRRGGRFCVYVCVFFVFVFWGGEDLVDHAPPSAYLVENAWCSKPETLCSA
ncbi:unnamed protein product [Choristocarpus tenellus]